MDLKPTIKVKNAQYAHIRGFNYQPSYARNGIESWNSKFDLDTFDRELGRGKHHFPGINTIRLWLSLDAFVIDPQVFGRNFDAVVGLGNTYGLKFIVTLFNFWHSIPDFGGVSLNQLALPTRTDHLRVWNAYLERVVGAHADDNRILLWDLCNEPPCGSINPDEGKAMIVDWLRWVYDAGKALGARAPFCVGAISDMDAFRLLEPISDVITAHPYYSWSAWVGGKSGYCDFLDNVAAFANEKGKAALSSETCWGSLDDKQRGEIVAFELGEQVKRGLGFAPHLLHESLVADAHREDLGPVAAPGYMAFIHRDGSLRPYHDVFNDFC